MSLSGSGRKGWWGGRLFEAGRLLTFSAFRMGAYSRWALIRSWALIRINTVTWKGSGNIVICIMLYGRTSTQIITYEFEQKGRNHMVLTDISKFLCTAEQLQNSEYQLTKRMTCKQKRVSIRLLWSTCLLLPNSHLVHIGNPVLLFSWACLKT